MAFNVVADPVVGYFYKTYVLGVPQDAAATWAKIGAVTTLVNAVVAVAVASAFYLAPPPRPGTRRPAEKGRLMEYGKQRENIAGKAMFSCYCFTSNFF